jgi:hypothetical protein
VRGVVFLRHATTGWQIPAIGEADDALQVAAASKRTPIGIATCLPLIKCLPTSKLPSTPGVPFEVTSGPAPTFIVWPQPTRRMTRNHRMRGINARVRFRVRAAAFSLLLASSSQ